MASHFAIGAGYACYRGPVTDGVPHRHAAFQIVSSSGGEVTVEDAHGIRHRAVTLVVPPMTRHRLVAGPYVQTLYIEPHSAFADRLRRLDAFADRLHRLDAFADRLHGRGASAGRLERPGGGIAAAPELDGLDEEDVRAAGPHPSGRLDWRLVEAMAILAGEDVTMPALAARVGLSPQRLRALAHEELGMPLTRWRIWRRLARAAEALRAGNPPAHAAIIGGFADQAHLHREMRGMIGLTPATVLRMVRDVDRDRAVDG